MENSDGALGAIAALIVYICGALICSSAVYGVGVLWDAWRTERRMRKMQRKEAMQYAQRLSGADFPTPSPTPQKDD